MAAAPLATAAKEKAEVSIPARTLNELNRLIADDEETVDFCPRRQRHRTPDHDPGRRTGSEQDRDLLQSEELGEDIGEIDAAVEGQEAKIAFNGKYLTDVLAVVKEQKDAGNDQSLQPRRDQAGGQR